jgi:Protein of unknown function (DUF1098)
MSNSNTVGPRPPRRRQDSDAAPSIYADELLQRLNDTNTIADLIINDQDEQKRNSIGMISRHSAIAKTILDAIDEDDSLRLNTVNTINVLKLMSDIFDNKIAVTDQ